MGKNPGTCQERLRNNLLETRVCHLRKHNQRIDPPRRWVGLLTMVRDPCPKSEKVHEAAGGAARIRHLHVPHLGQKAK